MSVSIQSLIPELQPFAQQLYDLGVTAGVYPRITSTLRTFGQQNALYQRYLRGMSAYTAAPPGQSAHEYGFAFDMICNDMESNLPDFGQVWESWGGVWGGRFGDAIHFEYPGFKDFLRTAVTGAAAGEALQGHGNAATRTLDTLAGFTPLGVVQATDAAVDLIAPATKPGDSVLKQIIQHPFSTIYDWLVGP